MVETQKVTPWFPENVKPVHVGVYEIDPPYGWPQRAFRKWDGLRWFAWAWSVDSANASRFPVHADDALPWRGLASKP